MSEAPKLRAVAAGLIALAALAGLAWGGWWLFRRAYSYYSGLSPAMIVGALTALACSIMIVLAIRASGALRATRLRCRAEAYEAALALVLPDNLRKVTQAERRRTRAQLLLWGSGRVLREFGLLEIDAWSLEPDLPGATLRLTALIRAMRTDLGQPTFGINILDDPDEDDPDEVSD